MPRRSAAPSGGGTLSLFDDELPGSPDETLDQLPAGNSPPAMALSPAAAPGKSLAPGPRPAAASPVARSGPVAAVQADAELRDLAAALKARYGSRLHLGTSSWTFPGWAGLVWAREYAESALSKHGLPAYAQHPLLNAVSLDRAFYRPLDSATYARLAAQVPADFRFVVKAPSMVCDATVREPGSGLAMQANPLFLDPQAALQHAVEPAVQGLGAKLGVLVFQISPLPIEWLLNQQALLARLEALWQVVIPALPASTQVALELRDARLLTPALAEHMKRHGVRYCLGLHDRMPPLPEQLPMLRATWPGDVVCRWNLQRGIRYTKAKDLWAPFDRLQAPDEHTRNDLAKVVAATLAAGYRAFVTINNKAEGSAPLSVLELARALLAVASPSD
jgi:uncharacterized protein YecE (DUF72 family)